MLSLLVYRSSWRLLRAPGFVFFAAVSLSVGIATTTGMYALLRGLFWKPLGISRPAGDLLAVAEGTRVWPTMSWRDFEDVRTQQSTFALLGAAWPIRTMVSGAARPTTVLGEAITGDYLQVMGLTPSHGRLLNPTDETSAARVLVVSDRFWRYHLQGRSDAIGTVLEIGAVPFEVVGIIDGHFQGTRPFLATSV